MRIRWTVAVLSSLWSVVLALPGGAAADPCRPGRSAARWRHANPGSSDVASYAIVKGGGMALGGDGSPGGGYFGLELGGSAANRLDLGFSIDWFHRHSRDLDLLFETDHGFEPPIRGEITRFETSADFVPLGLTLRLRLPVGNETIVPFASGMVGYEILHLEFFDRAAPPRPYDSLLGDSETLYGFAWQAAAGVEVALVPAVGLFGEAGLHRGEPARQAELDGAPVDLRARLNGAFLRAGIRVAL